MSWSGALTEVDPARPEGWRGLRRAASTLVVMAGLVFLAVGAGCSASSSEAALDPGHDLGLRGTVLDEPWARPTFTLTTTEGQPFDFATETAGRLTLLFFGYTSCPDVCPIHLATLRDALERPGMPDPVVVFVGVDPARDTPEAVRSFLDRFDPAFIGLVGSEAEIEAAQQATGVPRAIADPPADDGTYLVGHASQIVAYTPDDLAHVVYPFGVRQQDWARDLPRLAAIDWSDP